MIPRSPRTLRADPRTAMGYDGSGLACARSQPHTSSMTEEEIRQRVKEILRKRDVGEELTSQEETILAYAYYAAGEQAVRMGVGQDTETGG